MEPPKKEVLGPSKDPRKEGYFNSIIESEELIIALEATIKGGKKKNGAGEGL